MCYLFRETMVEAYYESTLLWYFTATLDNHYPQIAIWVSLYKVQLGDMDKSKT